MNPDFFKGTRIEKEAAAALAGPPNEPAEPRTPR
jgi:hypothetical protein